MVNFINTASQKDSWARSELGTRMLFPKLRFSSKENETKGRGIKLKFQH